MSKNKKYLVYRRGLSAVFKLIKPYKKVVLLLITFSVINSILTAVAPYVLGKIYDNIFTPFIFWIVGLWFLIQFAAFLFERINSNYSAKLGLDVFNDFMINAWSSLLIFPLSFHKKRRTGIVTSVISRAGNSLDNILSQWVINLVPQFLTIIFAFSIAFYLSWRLAIIILIGVSFYCVILFRNLGKTTVLQKQTNKRWNNAYDKAYEAIESVITIKHSSTENYEKSLIKKAYHFASAKDLELNFLNNRISTWQRITISLTQLSVIGFSMFLIRSGSMTVGNLITFVSYVGLSFGPFANLSGWWRWLQGGLIAIENADKIISIKPEKYSGKAPSNDFMGRVEFKDVNFQYENNKPVLNNISFKVEPGETVALVGQSGVGKSTIIDLIGGYFLPQSGSVSIDNITTNKLDLNWLRTNMAIVPQEVVLFNSTIKNNIAYGNSKASMANIKKASKMAHTLEFINKFPKKWKQVVGERVVKLSVGQKQRVAIARAILRNPKILILDEPTSALDAESEHFITKALEELMKGRTTFIIAHRLSTVRRADKILVFKDGQIAEMGKHDELIQKEGGIYRHLYELQIGLHQ